MFVVLHHIWLTSWPSFPHITGPWWLGWLLYGHMAVAVFIVVSGFSLALAPDAQRRRAARRRAALPAPASVANPPGLLGRSHPVDARHRAPAAPGASDRGRSPGAYVVHGLLLQDVVGSADTERRVLVDRDRVADLLRVPAHPPARRGGPASSIAVLHHRRRGARRAPGRRRSAAPARQDQRPHPAVPRPVRARRAWRSSSGAATRAAELRRPLARVAIAAARARSSCSPSRRGPSGSWPTSSGWTCCSVSASPAMLALIHAGGLVTVAPRARVAYRSLARALLLQHLPHPRPDRGRPRQVRVRADGPVAARHFRGLARRRPAGDPGALLRVPSAVRGAVPAASRPRRAADAADRAPALAARRQGGIAAPVVAPAGATREPSRWADRDRSAVCCR